jgi:hypothetical protein
MTSGSLKIEHNVGKFFMGYLGAFPPVAYRIVLAEKTAQITVPEKDRARALPADKRPFLPKMGPPARYKRSVSSSAEAGLTRCPVNTTFPRTEGTVNKYVPCPLHFPVKFVL